MLFGKPPKAYYYSEVLRISSYKKLNIISCYPLLSEGYKMQKSFRLCSG